MSIFLACLVAQSSALAFQPLHGRSAVVRSAVRSAPSMQMDWEAREEKKKQEEAEAYAKLLAHLRAPIRQYEGGWGDTALRSGGKDKKRFGTGPDGNLNKEEVFAQDGEELIDENIAHHAPLRDVGRRKGKYSSKETTLPPEKQEQLVLPDESFKVEKMEMSQTDEDFVIECAPGEEVEMVIDVEPMFLMKTEYFYGFTAGSDAKISINREASSDLEGDMPAKGHKEKGGDEEDVKITVKFSPGGATGEFEAYLGLIFPTEKMFSRFYKITGKSGGDGEATRDPAPGV